MPPVPDVRIRNLNGRPARPDAEWVLYWMTATRRPFSNFALQRAVELAAKFQKPLVVLEALALKIPYATRRMHQFILEGMQSNAAHFQAEPVFYLPFLERAPGEAKGLVEALCARACAVVSDDFPGYDIPKWLAHFAPRTQAAFEAVDSNGLYPMRDTERVFSTAFSFRGHLQKRLPSHLADVPLQNPLRGAKLPAPRGLLKEVLAKWPALTPKELQLDEAFLSPMGVDQSVGPAAFRGGCDEALRRLNGFMSKRLSRYAEDRNEPELDGTSTLSPYLHFGHLGAHQVFEALAEVEAWTPERLRKPNGGKKAGFWGMGESAEAYLDQLVTWRELGFNMASKLESHRRFESLPAWAKATLDKHRRDKRAHLYARAQLEAGQTHDPLWNAAQMQMVRTGWFHNYLRMLWGKKIVEWSESPEAALETMEHLMNRHSLDGRDPVSYSGYFWILGRYDRPWGPERPVFGTVRYMSSENTARKLRVKAYLERYAP